MRAFLMAIVAAAALAGAASQAGAATTFTDGDFSTPSGGDTFTTFNGDSFGPWTVTGSVDLIGGYWQAPTAGGGSVDLDGNSPGAISQTFTAAPGRYQVSFFLSGNPDGGAGVKTVDVSAGGASQVFTFNTGSNSRTTMDYVQETLDFISTGSTTLTFTSQDVNSPFGPVVGGVSVTAVPEPATWAIMLIGFGGLGAAMRVSRRKQHAAAVPA